ncbi:hypothetical protein FHR84_002663 [Actinopolyspora biskrensis]|uniref:MYXO-CTERM domain-containing protein n=1 Tax=Actinopolyspora biskrensis TaxID=1470178 RepID=A0A852Z0L6_9ACTN|nr:hypothetical protein [Actinopolyspora biskrensis]NYH79329.1 hypothetical protein [Actinopolyspora biskrensis]
MRTGRRPPSSGVLLGLLAACCGLLLVLAPGVAAAHSAGGEPRPPASAGARTPLPSATEYAPPAAGHGARSAPAGRGPSEGPTEESSSEQDRRYVIGAVGVGLVLLVLLVRRKRGKASIVLRWRKRS